MKSFTSSLDNNMKYTKPNRLLFRGLTEVNVHYQCFPDLETTPPGNTRNTANSEVQQYFWDPAPFKSQFGQENCNYLTSHPKGKLRKQLSPWIKAIIQISHYPPQISEEQYQLPTPTKIASVIISFISLPRSTLVQGGCKCTLSKFDRMWNISWPRTLTRSKVFFVI